MGNWRNSNIKIEKKINIMCRKINMNINSIKIYSIYSVRFVNASQSQLVCCFENDAAP